MEKTVDDMGAAIVVYGVSLFAAGLLVGGLVVWLWMGSRTRERRMKKRVYDNLARPMNLGRWD